MTYELGFCYVNVHGAGARACAAATTAGCVAAYAEDSQHAPQALSCPAGAEVIAKGAFDEKSRQQEEYDDACGHSQQLAVQKFAEVIRALEQSKGYPPCQQHKIKNVATELQVALYAVGDMQLWQAQYSPQSPHPVLCCSQWAYPTAEEHTDQQCCRQHPIGKGFGRDSQNNGCQKADLYDGASCLYEFGCFVIHV